MSINNKRLSPFSKKFYKILKRKQQDIERGIDKPGWVFPPVQHILPPRPTEDDPYELGKLTIAPFSPDTSETEIELANMYRKQIQKFILGKKPPQKRARPNHERDKRLARDKQVLMIAQGTSGEKTKRMPYRDRLIEKETKNIPLEQLGIEEKKMKKKLSQAKSRFIKPKKST